MCPRDEYVHLLFGTAALEAAFGCGPCSAVKTGVRDLLHLLLSEQLLLTALKLGKFCSGRFQCKVLPQHHLVPLTAVAMPMLSVQPQPSVSHIP
eukprot:s4711_g5.t1